MTLRVSYDEEADVLYLAREGEEEVVEEVYPGVSLEYDRDGKLLGIEILQASKALKDISEPLFRKVRSS